VLEALVTVREHWKYNAILIRRERLDLSRFSGQRHMAYNFFTRLLLQNRSNSVEAAVMYADEKSRLKEDNFFGYLETATNVEAGRCVLKKVESLDSKRDDLMQVTDLLTGCVNTLFRQDPGERKLRIASLAKKTRPRVSSKGLVRMGLEAQRLREKAATPTNLNPPSGERFGVAASGNIVRPQRLAIND
jgi:hypothetical protein